MAHELAFADANRPAPVRLLRLQLRDYSLGHEILLLRRRNALLLLSADHFNALPKQDQILALLQAVLICSATWDQNRRGQKWLRLWHWLNQNANWPLAIADFRNYLEQGRLTPAINGVPDATGRPLGGPYHARLLQFIIQNLGLRESEAFDYPFGAAQFHYFTYLELEGAIRILNQDEIDFETWCAEEEAKANKTPIPRTPHPAP